MKHELALLKSFIETFKSEKSEKELEGIYYGWLDSDKKPSEDNKKYFAWLKNKSSKVTEGQLVTPIFTGTAEEKLEALTLWTSLIGSIKKAADLPTHENKVQLLSHLATEVNLTIQTVTNTFTPVVVQPPLASQHCEEVEDKVIDKKISEKMYGTPSRIAELAGIKKTK